MTLTSTTPPDLQQAAKEHLWMHFTRMGGYEKADVPIIVRGDGCHLEDANGKRYLDALAGLFSVNIGYGFGEEIGQAALEQMRELPFYTNWSYAHPRAIELAAEVASLAPGDLNRVFFCSGGSEAVESAWKLARQYYLARRDKDLRGLVTPGARAGATTQELETETMHDAIVVATTQSAPRRYKAIGRHIAYHGTTFGALSINGIPAIRAPFEPLVSEVRHVSNTNRYHRPPEETEAQFTRFLLDELEQAIVSMGPDTVCLVHMEPVQNAGGCFTPPDGYWLGVREVCDRYDILLSADEVITAFGRVGHWFASERYDIRPDIVTCAKGLSSSYAALGAVVATDRVMEPFLGATSMFSHGITFGGHPVMCAIALKNIEIMKREGILEHVRATEDAFRSTLAQLLELPIVGDLRGTGFFYAIELVKDKDTRETFSEEECERLLRGYLSNALFDAGLICRADDRGDPVIQISPPLVAGQAEFDEITSILGDVLTEASSLMR
jgi:adenosylmethionine-8-amino-7-oxononanoate aminotransferase